MFPNSRPIRNTTSYSQQRGSALIIAVFIIVVMSVIGIAMVRILSDGSRATVSDVYGTRAYAAARSGAEVFLTQLFPLDAAVNTTLCPERSNSMPTDSVHSASYSINGLAGCSSQVRCDRLELVPAGFNGTHFRITAEGSCTAGDMVYSKQIILEAADGIF